MFAIEILVVLVPFFLAAVVTGFTAVAAPPVGESVTICAGVVADSTGIKPADRAIQKCLNNGVKNLNLPPGNYRFDQRIEIAEGPVSIATLGVAPCRDARDCARLFTSHDFVDDLALIYVSTHDTHVSIDRLIIDGGAIVTEGGHVDITNSIITETHRGLATVIGMTYPASGRITNNKFQFTSVAALVVNSADGLTVSSNEFRGAGKALIVGSARGSLRIERNEMMSQGEVDALVAIGQPRAVISKSNVDLRGLVFAENILRCDLRCRSGLALGAADVSLIGGRVYGNVIQNANQAFSLRGETNADFPVKFLENRLINEPKQ